MEESIRERLKEWDESRREIKVRTMTGKEYQGHISILGREYFCLQEHLNIYIFIDKIESIEAVY